MPYRTETTTIAPALYTVAQSAVILNVSEKTIRRFLERGLLHSSKAIRKKLIPKHEVDDFFKETC